MKTVLVLITICLFLFLVQAGITDGKITTLQKNQEKLTERITELEGYNSGWIEVEQIRGVPATEEVIHVKVVDGEVID